MKPHAVDFVGYSVTDITRSIAFYRDVLGLRMLEGSSSPDEGWAEFDAGNVTIDLMSFDKSAVGKGAGVALAVDDVKAALDYLKKKGVKVLQDFYETPVCWGAGIADPDGNTIYLHKRKDGTAG